MKHLHVIVGSTEDPKHLQVLQRHGWGRMWIDRKPRPYPNEQWGFDNGAFVAWKRGEEWNSDRWRKHLDRAYAIGSPYLAVLPDIVGAGARSLDHSLHWLEYVPPDWPWYLALQDDMTPEMVNAILDNRMSGLFLGGTNKFKTQAFLWSEFARKYGLKFHYARAGTYRKMRHARYSGADSIDSAFPLWKAERLTAYKNWWLNTEHQLSLPLHF